MAAYYIYNFNRHTGGPREIHQQLRSVPEGIRKVAAQDKRFR